MRDNKETETMKPGFKRLRKAPIAAAALAVVALCAFLVATAGGEIVRSGNLLVEIEGGITPKKLPRKTPAPIT
ncbi:MAG TPA: hypothetical protein VII45_00635, partial [Solirubrobacterales bacterium]